MRDRPELSKKRTVFPKGEQLVTLIKFMQDYQNLKVDNLENWQELYISYLKSHLILNNQDMSLQPSSFIKFRISKNNLSGMRKRKIQNNVTQDIVN